MIYLAINCHLRLKKNPNSWALKFEYFLISLHVKSSFILKDKYSLVIKNGKDPSALFNFQINLCMKLWIDYLWVQYLMVQIKFHNSWGKFFGEMNKQNATKNWWPQLFSIYFLLSELNSLLWFKHRSFVLQPNMVMLLKIKDRSIF